MEENIEQPKTKRGKKKIILIIAGGVLLFVMLVFLALRFFPVGQNSNDIIAPSAQEAENPLGLNVGLTFSVSNFELAPGESATVDVELFTVQDSLVSGGTFVVNYDTATISEVKLTPITGEMSMFGSDAIVSAVQYNPGNIVLSIDLPENTTPASGQGRIAELEFTTRAESKGPTSTKISFDMNQSSTYLIVADEKRELRTVGSDLDISFVESPVLAPDAQQRLQQQTDLLQSTQ